MVAKLTLVGNLGADPEVRYTEDGKSVVTCRVASNYRRRDPETRDWADATNWYRVRAFGKLAERMAEQANDGRLTKGARIIAFGRLEAGAYLDRNNQPQPSLELLVDDYLLADSRRGDADEPGDFAPRASARTSSFTPPARESRPPAHEQEPDLDDLPF
jgi:single-strand DNA-binding protein